MNGEYVRKGMISVRVVKGSLRERKTFLFLVHAYISYFIGSSDTDVLLTRGPRPRFDRPAPPTTSNSTFKLALRLISGQVKLRHGDTDIRLTQEPFPLYPGETMKMSVTPLRVVAANCALRITVCPKGSSHLVKWKYRSFFPVANCERRTDHPRLIWFESRDWLWIYDTNFVCTYTEIP